MERSILIVDDDHDVSDLLANLLDEEGYRVRSAFDEQEALQEIAREAPDLIVLDVELPPEIGPTLTNQLRAQGIKIPVVLVSAVYTDVDIPDVQFVPKPFDLDYIIQVIARVFAELDR